MRLGALLDRLQDGVARVLGIGPADRTLAVRGMLQRPKGDAAGYWLQLLIAAALATLGLALNSTAVVIGAMLIAPLMRPIVELSMGLATGSTPLVFRTGLRSLGSVLVVVLASMAFTALLPFHEPTAELLARTAPSLLDLFVAAACAVAGAYAVVMSSNDVATTAAGTSIGISLVPPLCTTGYGIATANWHMAKHAALLFTANVTGILTVAGLVFVIVGFGQVDVRAEERELDADEVGAATRIGRRLSSRLPQRLGLLPRLLFPVALLAAISVPLQSAVGEMTRRSMLRKRVAALMSYSNGIRVVHYDLDQNARATALRIVVVGDVVSGKRLEKYVRRELRALGERDPHVVVWAVPDADALSALSARLDELPLEVALPPEPPPPEPPSLHERLTAMWPPSAGSIVRTWQSPESPGKLRIVHLGEELGESGREVLGRALATEEGGVTVESYALVPIEAPVGEEARWLARALTMIDRVRDIPELRLCIVAPAVAKRRPLQHVVMTRRTLEEAVMDRSNVTVADGTSWRIEARQATCDDAPAPAP